MSKTGRKTMKLIEFSQLDELDSRNIYSLTFDPSKGLNEELKKIILAKNRRNPKSFEYSNLGGWQSDPMDFPLHDDQQSDALNGMHLERRRLIRNLQTVDLNSAAHLLVIGVY